MAFYARLDAANERLGTDLTVIQPSVALGPGVNEQLDF